MSEGNILYYNEKDLYIRALEEIAIAANELIGHDKTHGWYAVSDEFGDLVRDHLIPAFKKFVETYDIPKQK